MSHRTGEEQQKKYNNEQADWNKQGFANAIYALVYLVNYIRTYEQHSKELLSALMLRYSVRIGGIEVTVLGRWHEGRGFDPAHGGRILMEAKW